MKKIIIIMLAALVLISCCACKNETDKKSGLKIVASNFPGYDFAREIASDNAEITLLLSPGEESHSYEPTPKEIISILDCDVFICVGGESESWLDGILDSVGSKDMNIVRMIDCTELIDEELPYETQDEDGHEHDHDHGDGENGDGVEKDEHVWTSPLNAIKICERIEGAIEKADPENKDVYKKNLLDYTEELKSLDRDIKETVSKGKTKTLVFGDRFPFAYFAKEYGLECYAAFPGCSPETEPSSKTVAFLIDEVKSKRLPAVLYLEMSSRKIADAICEATGAVPLLFHSCHNVSKDELESGQTYLSLMRKNLETLKTALGAE